MIALSFTFTSHMRVSVVELISRHASQNSSGISHVPQGLRLRGSTSSGRTPRGSPIPPQQDPPTELRFESWREKQDRISLKSIKGFGTIWARPKAQLCVRSVYAVRSRFADSVETRADCKMVALYR